MARIVMRPLLEGLTELSDDQLQRRLWLGHGGDEIGSFSEAVAAT